ncbi:hypothetical protein QUF76_01010 [Desulfobacterales bacterium HSG16]|nr:hypothetical protein [Desulfobacterales bacterium HSG16]
MGFKWEKYLELAQHLYNNSEKFPDKEACYRAAVSRAYYAAYGIVCVYIRDTDGEKFDGGDCHYKIKQYLRNSGNKSKRTIANQLQMVQDNRKQADYYDNLREKPKNLASKTVAGAKKIISEVETLYKENSTTTG